jgi:hypothetical protein
MAEDPRLWFRVDADLWQMERKLSWQVRKIAIYLRRASGPFPLKDGQVVPNLAKRSLERIANDNGLSERRAEKAIAVLRSWPSRRNAFIAQADRKRGIYVLRPLPARWVRAYRWLLDSSLLDDIKDVLLFIRSRFAHKTKGGAELFDCNLYGEVQPSIRRCCRLNGTGNKARSARVKEVVAELQRLGLLVVIARARRNRAMVVELRDDMPIPGLVRPGPKDRGNGRIPSEVTAKGPQGNGQKPSQVTAEGFRGNDTPKSVPQSVSNSFKSKSSLESQSRPTSREDHYSKESGDCGKAIRPGTTSPSHPAGNRPRDAVPLDSGGLPMQQEAQRPADLPDPHPAATETLFDPPDPAKEWAARSAAAKELDSTLAIIRNPKTDRERRLLLADSYQRGTESLIPRFQIPWKPPRKRKLGEFLEAIERLEPEVITKDLILALEVLSGFEEPCWPVALEENTWCQVMEAAAGNAGIRLSMELRLAGWRGPSVLKAVRDFHAGLTDRRGDPLSKKGHQEHVGDSAARLSSPAVNPDFQRAWDDLVVDLNLKGYPEKNYK